ncbi:hypothetical protein DIPPA_03077 [Diplonema papillatum]|nr:hypothetical protein DIPPA_03077 [Diplonema papillatum]
MKTISTRCEKDGMVYSMVFEGSFRKLKVHHLKVYLQGLTGIPAECQALEADGAVLHDDSSCRDAGIDDGALLMLRETGPAREDTRDVSLEERWRSSSSRSDCLVAVGQTFLAETTAEAYGGDAPRFECNPFLTACEKEGPTHSRSPRVAQPMFRHAAAAATSSPMPAPQLADVSQSTSAYYGGNTTGYSDAGPERGCWAASSDPQPLAHDDDDDDECYGTQPAAAGCGGGAMLAAHPGPAAPPGTPACFAEQAAACRGAAAFGAGAEQETSAYYGEQAPQRHCRWGNRSGEAERGYFSDSPAKGDDDGANPAAGERRRSGTAVPAALLPRGRADFDEDARGSVVCDAFACYEDVGDAGADGPIFAVDGCQPADHRETTWEDGYDDDDLSPSVYESVAPTDPDRDHHGAACRQRPPAKTLRGAFNAAAGSAHDSWHDQSDSTTVPTGHGRVARTCPPPSEATTASKHQQRPAARKKARADPVSTTIVAAATAVTAADSDDEPELVAVTPLDEPGDPPSSRPSILSSTGVLRAAAKRTADGLSCVSPLSEGRSVRSTYELKLKEDQADLIWQAETSKFEAHRALNDLALRRAASELEMKRKFVEQLDREVWLTVRVSLLSLIQRCV